MYELRFFITDIKAFKAELQARQANLMKTFCFTDEYYQPLNAVAAWNTGEVSLRVRSSEDEKKLLYAEYELQQLDNVALVRNALGEKMELSICPNTINSFLKSMGCEKKATIARRSGRVFSVPASGSFFECTLEEIAGYGWTSEVELNEDELKTISVVLAFFDKTKCRPLVTTFLADFVC